ncbi:MAG: MBL fold metallo-hydrolase [Alphaproteobacteria bacterium]|nr:MBL fold metallo-hydrolase [Alphaproteobacteria bacterium]MBV9903652.1 MBL fold metallo-hydrolase [Alphaproteobacteria bacterium]
MRILAAAAILAFTTAALAAPTSDPRPQPQSITPGVWLIPGSLIPGRQPDGNTVVFDAPQGLIVMDTGRHKWQRQAILDFAKARNKPIAAIVNSHWHLDHVSGNPDIRAAYPGLKVYASNAIDAALTGFLAKSAASAKPILDSGKLPPETAEDVRNDIATFENGAALKPDVVIGKSATRVIAGKRLAVNLAPNAATDGDVWVYDPASHIVAAGDLVTLPAPFLDTACTAGWSRALARIAATPFKTLIPGHGGPMTGAQFTIYRRAFDAFVACSASTQEPGVCAVAWSDAVAALPGADPAPSKRAVGMATYYAKDVLRAHHGNSAECHA